MKNQGECYSENENKSIDICLSEKENLEAIFNSVADGIITVDAGLRVMQLNRAAIEYLGSRDIPNHFLEQKLPGVNRILKQTVAMSAAAKEVQLDFRDENGIERIVLVNTAILRDKQHNKKGVVLVFRDISELSRLRKQLGENRKFHNLIGKNSRMREIYSLIEDVAASDASTLIFGESGTGKELVANAIHYGSRRKNGPFIKLNCSALSEHLLESELFGHVKGAFTGAIADKTGRFQLADKGTIFLDEIGDISPATQVKLLRVLQERVIEKVGDATPVRIDVRIISATNKDLTELIKKGQFREDLYYRLKVVSVNMPPLRERTDDILLLSSHFIEKMNARTGKSIKMIDDEVLNIFMNYSWKGNIRELENAIEHAFVLCKGDVITKKHIPPLLPAPPVTIIQPDTPAAQLPHAPTHMPHADKDSEKEKITRALVKTGWNKSKAARLLNIDRTTIWRKIKEFRITEES